MGALKSKFRRSKSPKGEKDKGSSKKKKGAPNLPESQSARKVVDPRLPFSNYRQIFSIRNAWKAISRTMEECAKETLIRLFKSKPHHRGRFPNIKNVIDEDEMRRSEDFENAAMDIYQIFDDVVAELENVDKALQQIKFGAPDSKLTQRMMVDMEQPFIDTIRIYLGSDRFTDTTEGNFKLLYQFIREEVSKYVDEGEVAVEADVNTVSEPEVKQADNTAAESTNLQNQTNVEETAAESTNVEKHTNVDETAAESSNLETTDAGDNSGDVAETVVDTDAKDNNVDDKDVVSDTQVEVNLCADAAT